MIEPPDPVVAAKIKAERGKGEALAAMLAKHCRFNFKNGSKVKQQRIGDRTAPATFTVTRLDGEEKTFHHGIANYIAAHRFATAESVERTIDPADHPLMKAAAAKEA